MQEIQPGLVVNNRYQLCRLLGSGTFGRVFHAEDLKFQPSRSVAIKIIHSQYVGEAGIRQDIIKEASTLARFNHPNILRVIDFEITEQLAYIVTELAEGGSLAGKIRPDPNRPPVPLPLDEVAGYLLEIASALDEAHSNGMVHRDIKPQNILLDRKGHPLLADFGLSATLAGSQSSILLPNQTGGTPLYMAPEQWKGQAGKASDIYALGVMAYQLITGWPPYTGTIEELIGQHSLQPVPTLTYRAPTLSYPPQLDEIIAGAMAKDVKARTRPAGEFARRFKAALGDSRTATLRFASAPPASPCAQYESTEIYLPPTSPVPTPTPKKSKKEWMVGLGLLIIASLLLIIISVATNTIENRQAPTTGPGNPGYEETVIINPAALETVTTPPITVLVAPKTQDLALPATTEEITK